jgi:hydrogenase maturation protease
VRPPGPAAKRLVVGIGNPDRGDDGIGLLIVRQLVGYVAPDVTVIERSGDALALIDDWAGHDAVILVDAAASGAAPGSIHRIDLLQDELAADLSLSSTHAFGVVDAIGLARALDKLPDRLIAYAVEGADFNPGASVSPEVAAAISAVVGRIAAELHQLQSDLAEQVTHA